MAWRWKPNPTRRPGRSVAMTLGAVVGLAALIPFLPRSGIGPDRRPTSASSALDRVRQGDLALRQRRLSAAERSFRDALQLDPKLVPARLGLIWVLGLGMRRSEVLAEFEALALTAHPLDFDQVLLWTQVRCGIWDPDKVTAQLSACLDAEPENRWVRLALAEGLRRLGESEQAHELLSPLGDSDPEALVILTRLAIDRNDLGAAESLLNRGPADHPELAELAGEIALTRRDAPAAVARFRQALASRPDLRRSRLGLAHALRMTGCTDPLPPILDEVRKLDALNNLVRKAAESIHQSRNDGPLLRALGAACEALGYRAEARAWYNLAITRDPLDSEAQAARFRLDAAKASPADRHR
jgi:tetratricopeptide (TPR) repeat protein